MAIGRHGRLIVTQMHGKEILRQEFDSMEWGFEWYKRNDMQILRLGHDGDPEATHSFDFVEFSCPVSIEFEYE